MNRKIFNILVLVVLCVQLGAVEVYKNGDKSVSVVGEINVGIGYDNTLDYPIIISNGKSNYSISEAFSKTKIALCLGFKEIRALALALI